MDDIVTFLMDGKAVKGKAGQTILEASETAGIYIPRLCYHKELVPYGGCRVCTVFVNGRPTPACTQPIAEGISVENNSAQIEQLRADIIDMLFIEGNHFCMFCEKSGNCELQALAYRFGITVPKYPYMFTQRDVDASHPDIFLDRNRCILCARCIRASRDLDRKCVFHFTGRGHQKQIGVNARNNKLSDTNASITDKAARICPVGAIIVKREGFNLPIGQRMYDHNPIGALIEDATNLK